MGDFINNIISTPVANLLIIAGIAFLGIAVIGKIVGKIEPGKTGRLVSGGIGIILLVIGLLMHFGQTEMPKQPEHKPPATQTETKEQANIPINSGLPETQTETKEQTNTPAKTELPDLFVSEFTLEPKVPVQGRPVVVRIGVYNKGNKHSGPFKVQWWAGENFPGPENEWKIRDMPARGGRILKYVYSGYRSWYAQINTKVIIDPENKVKEHDKNNNILKTRISVRKR
ncbi:MAG: CARDB domain-containing protein [bacterium]